MFKVTQPMPELTGSKYATFKKTMTAAKKKEKQKMLDSIRRTNSTLPGEGPKTGTWGMPSGRGGRSRRRRKSRKKRRKSRRKRRR